MTNEEKFVNELIGYIFAYPDDDYMTMECLCRKLHKYGLIEKKDGEWTTDFIDRKTESNSEKPNNSTRSTMEQVDEPKTQTETQNSNLTFEKVMEQTQVIEFPDTHQKFTFARKMEMDGDSIKICGWEYKGVKDGEREGE